MGAWLLRVVSLQRSRRGVTRARSLSRDRKSGWCRHHGLGMGRRNRGRSGLLATNDPGLHRGCGERIPASGTEASNTEAVVDLVR